VSLQAQGRTVSAGPGREPQDITPPFKASKQSIPFSHRLRVQAGMKCDSCHQASETSGKMHIPGIADCMACQQSIKTETPANQQLARIQKDDDLFS